MASKQIRMELFSEPEGASVIRGSKAPLLSGDGATDYLCGGCGAVICRSVHQGEVEGVLFRCPECWRVNRVR